MRALILERNKKVGRRLARYLACAGYEVEVIEEPAHAAEQAHRVDGPALLAADAFDGELVARLIAERPALRGLLWTAEPLRRALRFMMDTPRLSNVCARKDFESTPRPWELLMVARRMLGQGARAKFSDFLDWGYTGFQEQVTGSQHRDATVARAQRFVDRLGAPGRVSELFGELAHELLMNAIYDAPVGPDGTPRYAQDRKAELVLARAEQPVFRLASDGTQLVMQVIDPFGRLERRHVFDGLARGLAGGAMDTAGGGAGLGMVVCHNATVAMFYSVTAGKLTEVTGIFDLDLNLREFRTQAKSLHYFEE